MSENTKVTFEVPSNELNPSDEYERVYVNGKPYQMKRDETVTTDRIVKDILDESKKLHKRGNKSEFLKLDEE